MKCRGKHDYCKNEALPGRKRCQSCADSEYDAIVALREAKFLRGECRNCPKKAVPGKKRCLECMEKVRTQMANYRERIKQNVKGCARGDHPNDRWPKYTSCSQCGAAEAERQRRFRKKHRIRPTSRKKNQQRRAAAQWKLRRSRGPEYVRQVALKSWATRRLRYGPSGVKKKSADIAVVASPVSGRVERIRI